jgi:hypothetical protein
MKEIVVVCLAIDAKTGAITPDAPFLVQAGRAQEPEVIVLDYPYIQNQVRE